MKQPSSHRALLGAFALMAAATAAPMAMASDIAGCGAPFAEKYPDLVGKSIVMGAAPATPPYAMVDEKDPNQIIGSDIELATAVFDCMGVDFTVKPGAWPGLFPAVVSGQIDVMFYLYYTPTRAEKGDFITYMGSGSGALVGKGNPKGITSKGDLCGKILTAGVGTVEEKQAAKWSDQCVADGHEPINVMVNTDPAAGFRLVASGRADAIVSDLPLINMMVQRSPDLYEVGYSEVSPWKIGAAVANDNPLGEAIFDALKLVQGAGVQAEIFAKYGIDAELLKDTEYLPE